MNETRASKGSKTRILKGFEGLSRLKDQQPSTDKSLLEGQKDSREPSEAHLQASLR